MMRARLQWFLLCFRTISGGVSLGNDNGVVQVCATGIACVQRGQLLSHTLWPQFKHVIVLFFMVISVLFESSGGGELGGDWISTSGSAGGDWGGDWGGD